MNTTKPEKIGATENLQDTGPCKIVQHEVYSHVVKQYTHQVSCVVDTLIMVASVKQRWNHS